jgi:hypothetical protein
VSCPVLRDRDPSTNFQNAAENTDGLGQKVRRLPMPWRARIEAVGNVLFSSITPAKGFDLFVTAERDSDMKTPSGAEVLRAALHSSAIASFGQERLL